MSKQPPKATKPSAKKSAKPKTDKPAPSTMPVSLVKTVPTSADIIRHVSEIQTLTPAFMLEMSKAQKKGVVDLAKAYVVLHRLVERMGEALKPYSDVMAAYKTVTLPEAIEAAGLQNVSLDEGFRVSPTTRTFASIKPDQLEEAYKWLRKNGHGDIIKETVNASSLSSAAKEMMEQFNTELPEKLFNVSLSRGVSVTQTK